MSDTTDPTDATPAKPDLEVKKDRHADMLTLEICFLAAVGLVVAASFFEALTYQLVSSRTPFVIITPLFVLIVVHAARLYRHRAEADFGHRLRMALAGQMTGLNKVVLISAWLTGLLVVIVGFGHYIGLGVFCFTLMWRLGGIEAGRALVVALGTVAVIYVVFEIAFDVELYRGLFFRWLAGYRDF